MASQIPDSIRGQKYISLTTFRKNGVGVATAVWFGEEDGKLYVMTRSDMGKTKRIRNNPQAKVAPCTISGKVTGIEVAATARLLPHGGTRASAEGHQSQILDDAAAAGLDALGYVYRVAVWVSGTVGCGTLIASSAGVACVVVRFANESLRMTEL